MSRIKYGQTIHIEPIDKGRSKIVKTVFQAGDEIKRYVSYEERIKVKDRNEELAQYLKFRTEHPEHNNVATRIETSPTGIQQSYYYLVVCWEEIV